jgi:integrase
LDARLIAPYEVQELLGHRHVTTTQIYDKRRRTTSDSASHDLVI